VTLARLRRRALQIAGVVVFMVLAGATYQGVRTALERRQFPHPGHLGDVGGHQLHLYCTGEGTPTVVLEAPAAGVSAAWAWVQPDVSITTRVCSYDRAGLGWSESGGRTFDPAAVAVELQSLLSRARERAPFVVVGHGFGAALARLDAQRFGADATALVLVDPPADLGEQTSRDGLARLVRMSPWLARAGVLRATGTLADTTVGLPEPSQGALRAFLNRPDHLTRASLELARWNDVMASAAAVSLHPGLTVITVDATAAGPVAFLATREQASVVTAAIRDAVERSRGVR
jgi:pimeloyl-ACP methyl ester carboxylesterase